MHEFSLDFWLAVIVTFLLKKVTLYFFHPLWPSWLLTSVYFIVIFLLLASIHRVEEGAH